MARGTSPVSLIHPSNGRLLVVATDAANSAQPPSLFRCDLDGTDCAYTVVSAWPGAYGGGGSAVIDSANERLMVVANDSDGSAVALFRCALDGTDCAYANISAG